MPDLNGEFLGLVEHAPAYCITVDLDWAPESMIVETLNIFDDVRVPDTPFLTHASGTIANRYSGVQATEVGVHPNFRAGKKTFAAYETVKGRPSIAFRLGSREIARLLRRQEYFVTPYGRGKWVSLWADTAIDWEMVTILLRRSYGEVALKRMLTALDGK